MREGVASPSPVDHELDERQDRGAHQAGHHDKPDLGVTVVKRRGSRRLAQCSSAAARGDRGTIVPHAPAEHDEAGDLDEHVQRRSRHRRRGRDELPDLHRGECHLPVKGRLDQIARDEKSQDDDQDEGTEAREGVERISRSWPRRRWYGA